MKFLTKVVPISKRIEDGLDKSMAWQKARDSGQPFLYLKYFDEDYNAYVCGASWKGDAGDYFLESDLIPYEEPKEPGKGKFIEIQQGNWKMLINIEQISRFSEDPSGTLIACADGAVCLDTRPYESIKQLLTDKGLML